MGYDTARGQLAASSTLILGAATGTPQRWVDVLLYNRNTTAEATVVSVTNADGTNSILAGVSLPAGAPMHLKGICLSGSDAIYGYTTTAAKVDYRVQPSGFGMEVYTATGSQLTSQTPQAMGTRRLALVSGRNPDFTVLDGTGGAGLFSLEGTVGTDGYLLGEASQNTTKTDKVIFEVVLPPEYTAAANLSLLVNIQRVVAAGTSLTTTIDAEVWRIADDGTAGSDLCATSAITYTNTAAADKTFTITGTTLSPGDRIVVQLTAVATEGGDAGTVKAQINSVRLAA